jgi:hypothetical protein
MMINWIKNNPILSDAYHRMGHLERMTSNWIHRNALLALCCCVIALVASATFLFWPTQEKGMVLVYRSHLETDQYDPIKKQKHPSSQNSTVEIVLLPDYLSVIKTRDGKSYQKNYDFNKTTITYIDHDAKTYRVQSLQPEAVSRSSEFQNRYHIAEMTKILGLTEPMAAFNQFEMEHATGMRFNETTPKEVQRLKVEEKAEGDRHDFFFDNKKVASYGLGADEVSPKLKTTFARYLAYEVAVHPEIRGKLLASGRFPMSLEHRNQSMAYIITHTRQRLVSAQLTRLDAPSIPQHYTQLLSSNEDLHQILQKAADISKRTSEQQLTEEIKDLFKQNKYLDAYLAHYELRFQSTKPKISNDVQALLESPAALEATKSFRKALQAKSRQEIEQSIAYLASIPRESLKHQHILDIFLGDFYFFLQEPRKGYAHLLQALRGNPYLVRVYVNINAKWQQDFEFGLAWDCMNQVVKLAPYSDFTVKITQFKENVRERHPDFF